VDATGLRTWSIDEQAVVQTKNGWRPLKDVLAVVDRPPRPDDGIAIIPFKKLDGEPLRPPPKTSELATLRFAQDSDDEAALDEDVYDGGPGAVGIAWMWTQRLVLLAVLGVGGYFAATTWQVWLPKAGQFGVDLVAQIQKLTGGGPSAEPAAPATEDTGEDLKAAVQAAASELPHLGPETIQLVMKGSLSGVLEPPEVFRRAHDAAERGTSSLTSDEAAELQSLKSTLFATLRPVERERVREYDQSRGVRATLPFEDRAALGSWAHGARALPTHSQERLRVLLGKAIRAGLRHKPAISASTLATR
jgi:hypothetical protein